MAMDARPHRTRLASATDESVLEAFAAGEVSDLDAGGEFAGSPPAAAGKSPLAMPHADPPAQPGPPATPELDDDGHQPPSGRLGRYRSDRPRGADFAWPRDVLDLMKPPRQDDLPAGPLVPDDDQQPHETPAPAAQIAIPADQPQALPARFHPAPPRRRASRRERLLILQLVLVAIGAWASVLLAWLLL